jgi:LacI family transcriptional regulator
MPRSEPSQRRPFENDTKRSSSFALGRARVAASHRVQVQAVSEREAPPTLRDVARLAGVSASTVSRILNGNCRVADDKRQAVEAAIHRLHFKPNLSARSLRSGSTMTIGVLAQHFDSPYFGRAIQGLDDGLQGSGYSPIVAPGHWNPREEAERMEVLMARGVDAIAILGGHLPDADILRFALQQPIVVTDRVLEGPNVQAFAFDQREGGRMATAHLIELGHRHIAHIGGLRSHENAIGRLAGFMLAHAQAGLTVDPRLVIESDFMAAGGLAAMNRLLDLRVPFTAAFCANDQTLQGAQLALLRRGLRVPDDISLVGFDDLPDSAYMSPPATTVRQPIYELGRVVAAALLSALGMEASQTLTPPSLSLVVRETTQRP